MYDERTEEICTRLCLLSKLEKMIDDPPEMTRPAVHALYRAGAISGLVLKEGGSVPQGALERARLLLTRSAAVCARLESYIAQGYQVLLPTDEAWPKALYSLKNTMPHYLFAKGNPELLAGRKASVAGSRVIHAQTRAFSQRVGEALAREGVTLVTGGASGVDAAALHGALDAGGSAIVIPAVSDHRILQERGVLRAMNEGRFLLLCETPPDEGFSRTKALTRNHTIYAMGNAALVIAARPEKGGSWSGAKACLQGKWTPVYVPALQGEDFLGNALLLEQGAKELNLENGTLYLDDTPLDAFLNRAKTEQLTLF